VDCPKPMPTASAFGAKARGWEDLGSAFASVFVDMGENGLFARDEFETLTALGQMEFITSEEVAGYVVLELQGHPTGRDVISALDASTAGPTYQAGLLRQPAIDRLAALEAEHGLRSVAFESLGPPRLSKHLYEGEVLSRLRATIGDLAASDPDALAREAAELIAADAPLRQTVVSIGFPILIVGDRVYRGMVLRVPFEGDIDRAATRGWVDLRPGNCAVWVARARRIVDQARDRERGSHSGVEWGAPEPTEAIQPPRLATWIFRHEDGGERIKR
jgi:hypothetical protein